MLSECSEVIKIDTTGRQATRPWVSKMADRRYGQNQEWRRVHLSMRTEGIKAFSKRTRRLVWTGENDTKTITVDANLFEKGAKQLRFRLKTD